MIKFPIVKKEQNTLLNLKGERSFFYEIETNDLDQLNESQVRGYIDYISKSFSKMNLKYIKFLKINGKTIVQLPKKVDSFPVSISSLFDPLSFFFEGANYKNCFFFDDYYKVKNNYYRLISIKSLPSSLNFLELSDLDYCLSFKRIDHQIAKKKLEFKRKSHFLNLYKAKKDFDSELSYSDAENLLLNVIKEEDSLCSFEIFFFIKDPSIEGLNDKTNKIVDKLSLLGLHPRIEANSLSKKGVGLSHYFLKTMPGISPEFQYRSHESTLNFVCSLLPLSCEKLMDRGVSFKSKRQNGLKFDLFSDLSRNKNVIITGESGSGKSVLINKLIHHYIKDSYMVIFDKGGSFKKTCLYNEGLNKISKINPLQFKNPHFLVNFIDSFIGLNDELKGALFKSIKKNIKNSQSFFELIEKAKKDIPKIDLYFEDKKDFLCGSEINRKLIYIDLTDYKKSLIKPLLTFFTEYFNNLPPDQNRILIIDEALEYISESSGLVDEWSRRVRKLGGSLILSTQSIDDIPNEIYNNSYYRFYFPQTLKETRDLETFDLEKIKNLTNVKTNGFNKESFSECYLNTSDFKFKKTLRIYLSALEYELFHTEFNNRGLENFLSDFEKYFNSKKECINSFIGMKYENTTPHFITL